jgi:glycosyltransferase involved in cell wall biosynthesis
VGDLIRSPQPFRDLVATRDLGRRIRGLRPELVHTVQSKSGILGRAAARRAGVPVLVHSVVMANFGPGFNPVAGMAYRTAERVAARWTTQFIVNGADLRERFVRAGIARRSRFALIRSSVDSSAFRQAAESGSEANRRALDLPIGPPIALFAGSLDRRKGTQDLPGFLESLRARRPVARVLVAGEGPLRAKLERDLEARGLLDATRFLGFTSRLPEALAASDCLVMLSRAEGLATVLLHAAASGRPFVSYDVDGPHELIELGAAGSVVPIGDHRRAADATAECVKVPAPGPLVLGEWQPDVVRSRYRDLFESLLGPGKSPTT